MVEMRFFNFINLFLLFRFYLPLEKCVVRHLKIKTLSPENALCLVWLQLVYRFLKKIVFNIRECIFAISLLSPLRKKLNSHYLRMLCANFGETGLLVLEKKILSIYFGHDINMISFSLRTFLLF